MRNSKLSTGKVSRVCTSFLDIPGRIAVAVYLSGCSIKCPGCHNKQLWDPSHGEDFTSDGVVEKILENKLAESTVFLGGEPTDQLEFLLEILRGQEKAFNPEHRYTAIYTGREFEFLPDDLLGFLDLVVCGPYKKDLHVDGGWPASKNQRIFKKEKGSWIQ